MAKIKLLVFDWDGTLVDSIERIVAAMHYAEQKTNIAAQDDQSIRNIIGLSLNKAFAVLYPQHADDLDLRGRFLQFYSDFYIHLESTPSAFYPQVPELLEVLRTQGYFLAVATGKSRKGLDRILQGHGMSDFFDITRCADETQSKPNPQMLEEILQHFQLAPNQAVMIGDSAYDLQMATNAKMASIAVSYGAQSLSQLTQEQPVACINHFSELLTWLEQHN
ncbi:HAD-IIIA family hydrolase [Pseudomonas sp. F1_0610]|uniref:HAD-IIIA family hydrolase n=1 Tax=Pseudomonas sp. F1_0610 TaxID=3114284 RepID=UPI0039C19CE6